MATGPGPRAGAAIGGTLGAVAAALASVGSPNDSVVQYERDVKAGKFLVLVHGDLDVIEKSRGVLGATGASHLDAHGG